MRWLKNRRRQIAAAVKAAPSQAVWAPAVEVPDGARREQRFQETKLLERRIESLRSGTLLDEEAADPLLLQETAAYEAREHTNLMDTLRSARRRDAASQSRCFDVDISGQSVFTRCTGQSVQWVDDQGLRRVDLRRDATIFIVSDISRPGNRILWVAALVGGCITSPTRETWFVYKRALNLQRFVWLSPGFEHANPGSAGIIRSLVGHAAGRRWRLVCDHSAFQRLCEKKPVSQMLGLVLPSERERLVPNLHLFSESEALRRVAVRDKDKSMV